MNLLQIFFFAFFLLLILLVSIFIIYDSIKYPCEMFGKPLPPIKKEYTNEDYDAFAMVAELLEKEKK